MKLNTALCCTPTGVALLPPFLIRLSKISRFASILFGLALALLTGPATAVEPAIAIRAASEFDYPPFSIAKPNGQADGFAVELMREALRAVGHDVQFKVGPWFEIKQELADGRIQALPLVARTTERAAFYDFTAPYLTMHGAIVARKGDSSIRSVEDLRGKNVVVMKGDLAEEYVQKQHLSDKVATTNTVQEALKQLSAGQYDVMVVQALVGENLLGTLDLSNLEIVGPPLNNYQQFCFAVRKGDAELLAILNEGLALVVANGTLERLREKWITPSKQERLLRVRHIASIVLGTLLLAWLAAYLWQRSLRLQVRVRTQELAQAVAQAKRLEEKSQESALYARSLLEASLDPLLTINAKGKITDVNTATEQVTGVARAALIGTDFAHYFTDPVQAREGYQQVFAKGFVTDYPLAIQHTTGQITEVLYNASLYRDDRGNVLGVFAAARDVTERKKTEAEFLLTKDRLEATLDAIPDLLFEVGLDGRIYEYHSPRSDLLAVSPDVFLGKLFSEVLPPDVAETCVSAIREASDKGRSIGKQYALSLPQGKSWFELSVAPKSDTLGQVKRFILLARDITERKKADELLRLHSTILENVSEGVYLVRTSDGTIVFTNPSFDQMFGYDCGELVGKHVSIVNSPRAEKPEEFAEEIMHELKRTNLWKGDVQNVKKDGTSFWCRASVSTFNHLEFGEVWVAVHADITKQHEASEALDALSLALARSNTELEQFAYIASHDLQEPLRMVVGYVQLLEQRLADKLDAETRKFMGYAVDGALRMQVLIQDILAYSRVTTQGGELLPVDSAQALQDALAALGSSIAEAGAVVDTQSLPVVMADRMQLAQVFQNLISNAIKFCKERTPHVTVEARREGQRWRFSVIDNGIGIAPEYRGQLFVIFKRLHTRREYPGTGIGLAICKRIIQRHGGEIGIESAPDGGTTFWFTMPEEKSL